MFPKIYVKLISITQETHKMEIKQHTSKESIDQQRNTKKEVKTYFN